MSETVKLGNLKVETIGRWKLEVRKDPKKFRLTNVPSYVPNGGDIEDIVRYRTPQGREVESLILDKIITFFKPDESKADKHNVTALIRNPKVKIGGISNEEWKELVRAGVKAPKPEFVLTNIDKMSLDAADAEADLVEARAVLLSKRNPISTEKLEWLCVYFGLAYAQETKIREPERYRVALRNKLDQFIQDPNPRVKGLSNLDRFMDAMDNIKKVESIYYVREMINADLVTQFGGIYKVGNEPVGQDEDDVIKWFSQNQEIFDKLKKAVLKKAKETV